MPHFDSPIKVPSFGNTLSENCPLSFACANGGREREREGGRKSVQRPQDTPRERGCAWEKGVRGKASRHVAKANVSGL